MVNRNNSLKKRWLLWGGSLLMVALIVVGLVYLKEKGGILQTSILANAVTDSDWKIGNPAARLTLIEYSDFQCPSCRVYHTFLKQLQQDFPKMILIVYRHFPLPQHQQAFLAALASEAAGKQGKFWEMNDLLFERQLIWSGEEKALDIFIEYAQLLNLNLDQFKKDLDSEVIKNKVESDLKSGQQAGLIGTPSFFINGRFIETPKTYPEFRSIIQNSL